MGELEVWSRAASKNLGGHGSYRILPHATAKFIAATDISPFA